MTRTTAKRRGRVVKASRIAAWLGLAILGTMTMIAAQEADSARGPVLELTVQGDVTPALLEYIRRGISEGEKRDAELVVIRLNTPGGLLSTTRRIAEDMLGSEVPIAVHVWPSGAHAGSAGTLARLTR